MMKGKIVSHGKCDRGDQRAENPDMWFATFTKPLNILTVEHLIRPWCRENLDHLIAHFGSETIFLRSESDYILFVLRWS